MLTMLVFLLITLKETLQVSQFTEP
jgi:hypothetical protein